jgi:hypothetical protein
VVYAEGRADELGRVVQSRSCACDVRHWFPGTLPYPMYRRGTTQRTLHQTQGHQVHNHGNAIHSLSLRLEYAVELYQLASSGWIEWVGGNNRTAPH